MHKPTTWRAGAGATLIALAALTALTACGCARRRDTPPPLTGEMSRAEESLAQSPPQPRLPDQSATGPAPLPLEILPPR